MTTIHFIHEIDSDNYLVTNDHWWPDAIKSVRNWITPNHHQHFALLDILGSTGPGTEKAIMEILGLELTTTTMDEIRWALIQANDNATNGPRTRDDIVELHAAVVNAHRAGFTMEEITSMTYYSTADVHTIFHNRHNM